MDSENSKGLTMNKTTKSPKGRKIEEEGSFGIKSASHTQYLTPMGEQVSSYSPTDALGQVTTLNAVATYEVKVNANQQLFDPFRREYREESSILARRKGWPTPFQLCKVTAECFGNYILFLKTRQFSYLRAAQGGLK